jgi:hypothetical protein
MFNKRGATRQLRDWTRGFDSRRFTYAGVATRLTNIQARWFRTAILSLLVYVVQGVCVVTKREEHVESDYLTDQGHSLLHEPWSFSGLQKKDRRTILAYDQPEHRRPARRLQSPKSCEPVLCRSVRRLV